VYIDGKEIIQGKERMKLDCTFFLTIMSPVEGIKRSFFGESKSTMMVNSSAMTLP